MTERSQPRGDNWRILLGVLVSLIALAVLFLLIDWDIFIAALKQADYVFLLFALPVYVVLQESIPMWITIGVTAICGFIMKKTWWDKLPEK